MATCAHRAACLPGRGALAKLNLPGWTLYGGGSFAGVLGDRIPPKLWLEVG